MMEHPHPAAPPPAGRPDPDPTILTTQQLHRELTSLRELLDARFKAAEIDRGWLRAEMEKIPMHIIERVDRLLDLHEEKFRSIQIQFTERDIRTEQTSRDSKVAVDAALQAAKEAVGEQNKSNALAIAKNEAATTKQIDGLGVLIQTGTTGLNDKIDDIKSRLTTIEGRSGGIASSWGVVVAVIGMLVGAGGMAIGILR